MSWKGEIAGGKKIDKCSFKITLICDVRIRHQEASNKLT